LLEGSYQVIQWNLDYKSEFEGFGLDETVSFNRAIILAEYGWTENLATGFTSARQQGPTSRGIENYNFYLKYQYDFFFSEINYLYSHDDRNEDNVVSGGSHFELTLGIFINNWGLRFTHRPSYSFDFEDDNTDYESGAYTYLEGFYEFETINENKYGFLIALDNLQPITADGTDISRETKNYHLGAYTNQKVGAFEIIPRFAYSSQYDISNESTVDSFSTYNFRVNLRYRF
jgi:hypothetical protein